MRSFVRAGAWLAMLCLASAAGRANDAQHLRGTLVEVSEDALTVANEDEEEFEVALTEDTGIYVVSPAKFADIAAGQFVGVTSVAGDDGRVALEVHIFAEDLRGTGEGHFPWDLVKEDNTMTNATIAEIKEASPVERVLRLTYKEGEGHGQSEGEQTVRVPDFADVVLLEAAPDRSVLVPERPVFVFVEGEAPPGPTAIAIAVGIGVTPPM